MKTFLKGDISKFLMIFIGSIIFAFSLNGFLIPHKILSGGVTGIAMIIGILTPINTGVINFALNIPILILGYLKLGKRFVAYSVFSVATISTALIFIPVEAVAKDPIISSVFGGVIGGIAIGIIFRAGGSSGGFDIIGLVINLKRDISIGKIIFMLNAFVVFISGFIFEWDLALYTLVSIFAAGKVVDAVHTKHVKLTATIISSKGEEIRDVLLSKLYRGITIMEGEGAFTGENKKVLYTVITRYELTEIKTLVKEIDPQAFINITETVEVIGTFRR